MISFEKWLVSSSFRKITTVMFSMFAEHDKVKNGQTTGFISAIPIMTTGFKQAVFDGIV
jgi:hypothetical protein